MEKNENKQKETGTNLSPKWIYTGLIVLFLGFCVYGYFKVSKWIRYTAIERYEKPITDYTITKLYSQEGSKYRKRGRSHTKERKTYYYMNVLYKGKDYKLDIERSTYSKLTQGTQKVDLYYDTKSDEIFVAGTGGTNLFVTAFVTIFVLVIIFFILIWKLIKKLWNRRR